MSLFKRALLFGFLLCPFFSLSQNIPASDASKHVGEQQTVCGKVTEVHTATTARGMPTFIDFDKSYPNESFTAVVWQSDKATVGAVPHDGSLCVKGTITEYRGRPEIVLHTRSDWSISGTKAQSGLSNDKHYTNADGQSVHSPARSTDGAVPAGATAQCADGTYSFSTHRQGTCSHHGGVAKWL